MKQGIKSSFSIGESIRDLRTKKGLTQDTLVSRMQLYGCDLSRSTYAKIESGLRHIALVELQALSEILDADYNALLGYKPSPHSQKNEL